MHQELKKVFYIDDLENTINYHLDVEKGQEIEIGEQKILTEEE